MQLCSFTEIFISTMGKQNLGTNSKTGFEAPESPTVPYAPGTRRGRPPKQFHESGVDMGEAPGHPEAKPLPIVHPDTPEFLGDSAPLMDVADENTIFKYLPESWQKTVQEMENSLWVMSFPEILRAAHPNSIDLQLRTRIWVAYEEAAKNKANFIEWKKVYTGICSFHYFYEYSRRPVKLRFLLEPLKEYKESVKQLLEIGMARLQEIITMPLTNKNGAMDPNLIEKVIKCIVLVDHRIHGGYTQRAELKAQQLSAHLDLNKVKSMEEIDAALEEMEKKSKQTPGTTIVIEQKKPMKNILDSISSTSSDSHRDLEEIEGRGSRGGK